MQKNNTLTAATAHKKERYKNLEKKINQHTYTLYTLYFLLNNFEEFCFLEKKYKENKKET